MVLILNSYIMSSLPPAINGQIGLKGSKSTLDNINQELPEDSPTISVSSFMAQNLFNKPIRNMLDVSKRILEYNSLEEEVQKA